MRKTLIALTVAALVTIPGALAAQGFGIAGRAGTLGVGGEAALGLSDAIVIRGGLGLIPVEVTNPSFLDVGTDVDITLKLPETWFNVGADLYVGSSFRIGAGLLFKPDNPAITGTATGSASFDIGGQTYTASDVATLTGEIVSKEQAPYALIGFGKHTSTGIGLFLDLGVAFLGDPDVQISATGNSTVINSSDFQSRLRTEEASIEDDVGSYLRYWPIINLGLRIGLGG